MSESLAVNSLKQRREEETVVAAGRVGAPPDRQEAALFGLVKGLQGGNMEGLLECSGNGPLLMDETGNGTKTAR